MNHDIVESMRAEEADLIRKLKAVREFLAAYGGDAAPDQVPPQNKTAAPNQGSREKVEITAFTAQTRLSVVLAMMAMATGNGLMKTRDLVAFVDSMGHEISGNNKVNALGALLARSVDIESHGKSGWSLVDRDKALAIISQHGPKENEPHSEFAGGSDADHEPVRTGPVVTSSTLSWPRSTS